MLTAVAKDLVDTSLWIENGVHRSLEENVKAGKFSNYFCPALTVFSCRSAGLDNEEVDDDTCGVTSQFPFVHSPEPENVFNRQMHEFLLAVRTF